MGDVWKGKDASRAWHREAMTAAGLVRGTQTWKLLPGLGPAQEGWDDILQGKPVGRQVLL